MSVKLEDGKALMPRLLTDNHASSLESLYLSDQEWTRLLLESDGEVPPEAWDEDDIDPDAPDSPSPRTDDVPEVEQPTKPYEEDELPLEAARDLDELPADADLVEDESAVDHNLPGNEGMPQ